MKAIIRVPTVQFGYIEMEIAPNPETDAHLRFAEVAVALHNELIAEYEKTKAEVQKLKDDNF